MNRNPLGGNNFGSTASTGTTASAVSAHQTTCGTIRVRRDDSTNGGSEGGSDGGGVGQSELALGAVAAILILFVALS